MDAALNYLTTRILEPSMLLQNVVTVLCTMLLFADDARRSRRRVVLHFLVLFVLLVGMNTLWDVAFNSPGSYFLTHIAMLLMYVAWQGKLQRYAYLVTIMDFYAVEISTISLSSVFPNIWESHPNGTAVEIVFRNATVLFTLLAAAFFRRYSLLPFRNISAAGLGYSALVCTSTVAISLVYFFQRSQYDEDAQIFCLFAFISILVLSLVAYYLSYATSTYQEREKRLVIENYSMQNYREMLRLNQQNLEDIRRIRHDMKNHFSCVGALLEQGQYTQAAAYFDSLKQSTVQALSYIDCGNTCISAILNLESSKARSYGVGFDYRVAAAPDLPIEDDALCALLTNLIDNAIEAIQRQNIKSSLVEVGINQRDNQLYICVKNPVSQDIDNHVLLSLKTTKREQELHGYGHKIVADIVNHYNGMLNRSVQNGSYIVDIVLNLAQT